MIAEKTSLVVSQNGTALIHLDAPIVTHLLLVLKILALCRSHLLESLNPLKQGSAQFKAGAYFSGNRELYSQFTISYSTAILMLENSQLPNPSPVTATFKLNKQQIIFFSPTIKDMEAT